MSIPTNIHLSFFEDNSLKPQLVISRGDSNYEVRKGRWVQFLTLLVYRRLTNTNDGWVTPEDISHLSAFRQIRFNAIGKYISDSSAEFPHVMLRFIRRYMDITSTGPYILLIDRSSIITDILRIKEYLDLISTYPTSYQNDSKVLWDISHKAYSEFDLLCSQKLTEAYIKSGRRSKSLSASKLASAYIRLADIEYRSRNSRINPFYAIEKAKSLCSEIKQTQLRNLILAHALGLQAMSIKSNKRNIKKIIELNRNALDLLSSASYSDPDKHCLMAGRHYHQSYIALSYGNRDKSRNEFRKAIEEYRAMQDTGHPDIVYCEPGIIEGIQLQSIIIKRVRNNEPVGNEELTWYYEMVENGRVSPFLTLTIGEWIARSLSNTKQLDGAVEFLGESLISHAHLHETDIFHRLVSEQRKLKAQL